MRHKQTLAVCLVLLGGLFLSGCVFRPPYPEHWEAVSVSETCPNVDGHYMNRGESQRDHKPLLYQSLFAEDTIQTGTVESVRITQQGSQLLFQAYQQDSLIREQRVRFDPTDHKDGLLRLGDPSPEGFVNREGVVGYERNVYWLTKTADGKLVVRSDSGAAGVVLLIPIIGVQRNWYRFPVSDSETGKEDTQPEPSAVDGRPASGI